MGENWVSARLARRVLAVTDSGLRKMVRTGRMREQAVMNGEVKRAFYSWEDICRIADGSSRVQRRRGKVSVTPMAEGAEEDWISTVEAAQRLGVRLERVRQLIQMGRLRCR